ncbi:MAG: hypothetical protein SGARI_002571 [Bacillariaceae sp.]
MLGNNSTSPPKESSATAQILVDPLAVPDGDKNLAARTNGLALQNKENSDNESLEDPEETDPKLQASKDTEMSETKETSAAAMDSTSDGEGSEETVNGDEVSVAGSTSTSPKTGSKRTSSTLSASGSDSETSKPGSKKKLRHSSRKVTQNASPTK